MEPNDVSKPFEDLPLDILGQTERINRLYTQITLCFPIPDGPPSSRTEIIDNLNRGLPQLSFSLPWVAGSVVQDDGVFKIRPSRAAISLVVRELDDDTTVSTWDELQKADFPFRMLDEDAIAPCKTMVDPGGERPVLMVQASFVKGGVLITFNAQHGSMDMTGQAQIMTLFAKACRGEQFTEDEVNIGSMQRTARIPLPDDDTMNDSDSQNSRPQETAENVKPDKRIHTPPFSVPPKILIWAYFEFSSASLSNLKTLANQHLTGEATFVSTDDVLTAFVWQSITRARQPRLDSPRPIPTTTLSRNVDVRRHFNLPPTYPGLVTTATSHLSDVDDLLNQRSLGAIASELRAALDPDALRNNAQSQAAAIATKRGPAAAQRSVMASNDPSLDVRLSSWAKEKLYSLDFGPGLGQPQAVRRPRFGDGAREGLVYLLPKARNGAVVVGICLREEDMERMKVDGEVLRWSRWIG
ncbi:hypothetical protein Daus18300_000373 [Diaporthe australafricana]|uniref:Trichothecene 3-O-acetyltransferase-like N-terminal domain-containing protein n=1 Tax=Diaporthe australafricana TaxID=127596 RepID=A0ABR3Y4U0_9PEZI